MRFVESIKNGFGLINRNWQLVLVQIAAMFVSFFGFFILVGFPLAVAFIIFGLDLTELLNIHSLFSTFHRPAEILSRYFGLAVLVLASILLYLIAVLSLGIYIFGGSIGVISRSIKDSTAAFSMKTFLSEGKRLFFPLVGFTTIVGLIFIAVAFVLGLCGGTIAVIVSLAREYEATLALFLGIFFSSILFIAGIVLILATLAVTLYGAVAMTIGDFGPLVAIKEAVRYSYKHAGAFFLYCIVFFGFMGTIIFLLLLSYPLIFIPLIGPFLATVFRLFTLYIAQSYLWLVMLAAICWYYSITAVQESGSGPGIVERPSTSGESTPVTDISGPQVQTHEDTPPGKEPNE